MLTDFPRVGIIKNTSSGSNFTRGCTARGYFIYFIPQLFAPMLRNDIGALQLSGTAPIVFAKHDGSPKVPRFNVP